MLLWESSRYPPGQTITRSASRCALARGEHHREGIGTKEGRAHLQEPQHQARGVLQPTTNALAIGPTQGGVPAHRGEHRWLRGRPAADAVYRASGIELFQRIEQGLEQDSVPAVEDSEKVRCRNCQTLSPSDAAGSTAVPPYWELPSITALGFTGKAARFGNGASGPAERVVSAPGIEPRTYFRDKPCDAESARSRAAYNNGMARDAAEVLRDALALPPEARAALVGSLLDSLDVEIDEAAEHAWQTEIRRRLAQLDSGAVQTIPWAEVRSRLHERARS